MENSKTVVFRAIKPFTEETSNRFFGKGDYELEASMADRLEAKGKGVVLGKPKEAKAKGTSEVVEGSESISDIKDVEKVDDGQPTDPSKEAEDDDSWLNEPEELPEDFMDLRTRNVLQGAGFTTIQAVRGLSKDQLTSIKGISEAKAISIGLALAERED